MAIRTEIDTSHSADAAATRGGSVLGHFRASLATTVILGIICCGLYPLVVWGISQAVFPNQANGSLVKKDGTPTSNDAEAVGSRLLGQNFSAAAYFHPRSSAAGNGYDASSSGGTNLGPLSAKLINGTIKKDDKGNEVVDFDGIRDRIVHYCVDNNLPFESSPPLKQFQDDKGNLDDVKLIKSFNSDSPMTFTPKVLIPGDAVTASGSGLDPHVSPANAELQKSRVAQARGISEADVEKLIEEHTDRPDLGILGDPGVNVLMLNLALDARYPVPPPTTAPTAGPTSTPAGR